MQTQLSRSCLRAGVRPTCRPVLRTARPAVFVPKSSNSTGIVSTVEEIASANGVANQPHHSTGPLNFDELSDIIRLVHDTDIVEFELKSKRFNLAVRKREALKAAEPVYQVVSAPPQQYAAAPPPPAASAAPAPAAAAAPAPAAAPPKPEAAVSGGIEIASPMSGTFYRSPAPGEPPFVQEGDKVKKGQTIGIVEAMKLMNEIEAEVGGEVVKVLIDNGQAVSPGTPLLLIRP